MKRRTIFRGVALSLVLTLGGMAAEKAPSNNCEVVRQSVAAMAEGIRINYAMLVKAADLLHRAQDEREKISARSVLENMNRKSANRAENSKLSGASRELTEAYRIHCGTFTPEDNATLSGMIERSRQYNEILARELGDELSRSKLE
jgi:hypothetical protein